jgi:hypothetical protein
MISSGEEIVFVNVPSKVSIRLTSSRVAKDVSGDVQVFPNDQCLDGAELESLERILNAETVFTRVLADLVEVLLDQLLFLNELDVCEGFRGKFYGLAPSPRK